MSVFVKGRGAVCAPFRLWIARSMGRLGALRIALLFWWLPGLATAHEFWLAPESYRVPIGGEIAVRLRNGELFEGPSYVYNAARFTRFGIVQGGTETAVQGEFGDDPALVAQADADGLAIIVHETTEQTVLYQEWERFVRFVTHKGYPEAADLHLARGLPQTGFREAYYRYAKSLVAVGSGLGTDAPQGLKLEFVALANPYTDPLSGALPFQVLYEGAPRAKAQVEIFRRAPDGAVDVSILTADENGEVSVPLRSGHEYLLDSVVLLERVPNEERSPVWESHWASLTFRMPD